LPPTTDPPGAAFAANVTASLGARRRRYAAKDLSAFMAGVLRAYGMPDDDAELGARILTHADLSGVDTHGIANFVTHWHYAEGLRDGSVQARPKIEVLRESPVATAWDAGRGFGPIVAHRAMSAAIDKAAATGIGMVTVRGGCHFGAHGYYVQMATEHDMIGMSMCHTAPSAMPPSGLDKVVGTNPLGFGAPVAGSHPFVLDMATTAAAGTKLVFARRRGEPIPWGWASDANGEVTTDAEAAGGGALLPLGSTAEMGANKGLGLGLVVDILSGVLSGTGSGLFQQFGPEWRQGYWMAAWRIDAFVDVDDFNQEMARTIEAIHASRPAPGHDAVLVPGDRAAASRADRAITGIPLDDGVVAQCQAFSQSTSVPFPDPIAEGPA
jgi:LDH2 family malate/lactate/ureidoglycolate dehydrogenase